jgi:ABC-2 type transport system permease protein
MVLVIERKQGAHARLLGTPVPRAAVVAGHGLAMLGVVLAQIVVLEAFGQVALGVHYLRHPWATLALTLALALWSAGLGMLIGAFARTEQQVVASGLLAMFLFSGLGGAWFPLEITGPTFTAVGHLTPTAWAMDAYRAILLRGGGLREVALPLAVLVGCAVVFYVLAVVRLARRPS